MEGGGDGEGWRAEGGRRGAERWKVMEGGGRWWKVMEGGVAVWVVAVRVEVR